MVAPRSPLYPSSLAADAYNDGDTHPDAKRQLGSGVQALPEEGTSCERGSGLTGPDPLLYMQA